MCKVAQGFERLFKRPDDRPLLVANALLVGNGYRIQQRSISSPQRGLHSENRALHFGP